jgi:UDP-N-acetylmuramoyl-L-alanyl-D-glutamate--2,6-diaminopimelate ligase
MLNMLKNLKIQRRIIAFLGSVHFFGNPSAKLNIIGVTGTSGKTTTVTLLYDVAMALGYRAGLISTSTTLANGKKLDIERKTPTMPDVLTLNKIFKKMVEEKCEYVFMEVTSQGMDQKRAAGIKFTGGVFTNFSQDHLDYHKDMEDYFNAKHKFFKFLPQNAFALANTDDVRGIQILKDIKAKANSYGFKGNEDFHGEIKNLDFSGLELSFNNEIIKTKLLGEFNAYNLLAVWSTSKLLGFDMNKVNKILETVEPPRGRFEHFTSKNGVLVIVDYAHKPDALEKIFNAIKKTVKIKGKLISVFGCGGDKDPFKRPIMGKIGASMSDIAIFTSDNPRSEDPDEIIKQMQVTLSEDDLKKVKIIANRSDAIKEAVKIAESGDIILCAGKGDEDYQIIKGVKSHFDDMEEFKKAYAK